MTSQILVSATKQRELHQHGPISVLVYLKGYIWYGTELDLTTSVKITWFIKVEQEHTVCQ